MDRSVSVSGIGLKHAEYRPRAGLEATSRRARSRADAPARAPRRDARAGREEDLLDPARLVHGGAGVGNGLRRIGTGVDDLVQRVTERAPPVVELGVLRAGQAVGRRVSEALGDRVAD